MWSEQGRLMLTEFWEEISWEMFAWKIEEVEGSWGQLMIVSSDRLWCYIYSIFFNFHLNKSYFKLKEIDDYMNVICLQIERFKWLAACIQQSSY